MAIHPGPCLRWSVLGGILLLVSWCLWSLLPPRPRWITSGNFQFHCLLPKNGGILISTAAEDADDVGSLIILDQDTGRPLRTLVKSLGSAIHISRNRRFGIQLDKNGNVIGVDLLHKREWHVILPGFTGNGEVIFASDCNHVAIATEKHVFLLDTRAGAVLGSYPSAGHRHFFAGDYFLSVSDVLHRLFFIDLRTQEATISSTKGAVREFSPDGSCFVMIENADSQGDSVVALYDFPQLTRRAVLAKGFFALDDLSLRFSSGRLLAVWSRWCEPLLMDLWDYRVGDKVWTEVKDATKIVEFSPDGNFCAILHEGDLVMLETKSLNTLWRRDDCSNSITFDADSRVLGTFFAAGLKPAFLDVSTGGVVQVGISGCFDVVPLDADFHHCVLFCEAPEAPFVVGLLREVFPPNWVGQTPTTTAYVLDLKRARILQEVPWPINANADYQECFHLSDDAKTLLCAWTEDGKTVVQCWELPFGKNWVWIIGIPGSFFLAAVAYHRLRHRKDSQILI